MKASNILASKMNDKTNVAMLSCAITILHLILLVNLATSDNNFIYDGFKNANLSLNELAVITSDGLVRLTNDTKEAQGHAFYPIPLRFKNSSDVNPQSFSTTFVFAIVAEYPDVSGHGIAFAISPSKELPGSMPSQNLGLLNTSDNGNSNNHIIAIELDTVKTVEFKDINDNHVGIDVNSLISVNSTPVAYVDPNDGLMKSLKLISGDRMQVWIDYSGITMQLAVTVAPLSVSKPAVPLLISKINISLYVLDEMYVGFSASTGAATGHHYILGWSFSLGGITQPLDISKLPEVPIIVNSKNKGETVPVLVISVVLIVVVLSMISVTIVICVHRRKKKYAEILEDWELDYGPQRFLYKDLYQATGGFDEEHFIGAGGFGKVYKGTLKNSMIEIAVKRISHESRQGIKEFVSEIVSMGRLRHRNLVQLLGYCRRQGELLLVYDYMTNGSLDKFIFEEKYHTLSWNQRFQIIKGVAAGLLYLHEGWEQVVIHRDIKASNVLLDVDFNAKLGDFGLARLYDHGTNPRTTHIVGTLGYLAPEFSKTGKATTNTDVYAFGAFLLEVVCGRRPLEGPEETTTTTTTGLLVDFVLQCWKNGVILEAVDQKLGKQFTSQETELVLKLGLLCSHPDPLLRPRMKQVVQILEGDCALPVASPTRFIGSVSSVKYDDSFDDFVVSYPSTSFGTDTSPIFSTN